MEFTEGWRETDINPVMMKQYNSKIGMGTRAGASEKGTVSRT